MTTSSVVPGASTSDPSPNAAVLAPGRPRIVSLDVMRGLVMVLMAIDHVRVYSGMPAGGPSPGIFLTRWVTHFCAPAFVFFAGTAAFLHGRKLDDKRALARYLVTRGILLLILELTVIKFGWTFKLDYDFVLAGVIWMLGWCMVLLGALIWLPTVAIGAIGLAIIVFQNVFGLLPNAFPVSMRPAVGRVWEFIYSSGLETWPGISVLYVIVPWIGVMAAGYAFGAIMIRDSGERRRLCLVIGVSATLLFVVVAGLQILMGDAPAEEPPALFRFLNQRKYPASLLFLLMTLGPTIALLPLAERARGWFSSMLAIFGQVPMFYYLLHIPVIHVAALIVTLVRQGAVHPEWYATAPYTSVPGEYRWGLPLLYLVFVIVVAVLYAACRWFAGVKARRRDGWLRYI